MPQGVQINLFTLYWHWGAAKRGRGVQQPATSLILPESFTAHTGSFQGMRRAWEVSKGAPNETPMSLEVAEGA